VKAVVQRAYGAFDQVLEVQEIGEPVVRDTDVLVRVRAALVHADVWHTVTGTPYVFRLATGLRTPRRPVPGTDLAGDVVATGRQVTRFRPGDEVFGMAVEYGSGGAFAEFAAVPERLLVRKPSNVTFEQAASVPTPGSRALILGGLDRLKAGDRVLVNGAGGCVGTIAVQLATAAGAHVTGVDRTEKIDLLRRLGADEVVDFTREDVRQRDARYDFLFDVASTLSLTDARRLLTPRGVYWLVGHDHYNQAGRHLFGAIVRYAGLVARTPFDRHLPRPRFKLPDLQETLHTLGALLESRTLTPIVGRTFSLGEVATALRCLQEGRAAGAIVLAP
jgi:NADPH:quinone reductase-like Zn-dependent oxidoreductase